MKQARNLEKLLKMLEELYKNYNRRDYVSPDPLQFLYHYSKPENVELAGFISSSFAFGNVKNILNFLEKIFYLITPPGDFFKSIKENEIDKIFKNFKYRFADSGEIIAFFKTIKKILEEYSSLYNLFYDAYIKEKTIINAMKIFIDKFYSYSSHKIKILLPNPENNSAFKRFFLFLRWMIRKDDVDLGIWDNIPKNELIVPLDTHMYNISKKLNFTKRKVADLKTAIEITEKFKLISPEDPVKYDFVLTRFGIHPNFTLTPPLTLN